MGGTRNPQHSKINKLIWNFLLLSKHGYYRLPSKLVEWQSRLRVQEGNRLILLETSSEGFSKNNQTLRSPNSRSVSLQAGHQLFPYIAWKPDPDTFAKDAVHQVWKKLVFALTPFCLISRVISKVLRESVQPWYTFLLGMSMQCPLLLRALQNLLLHPQGKNIIL